VIELEILVSEFFGGHKWAPNWVEKWAGDIYTYNQPGVLAGFAAWANNYYFCETINLLTKYFRAFFSQSPTAQGVKCCGDGGSKGLRLVEHQTAPASAMIYSFQLKIIV